MNLEKTKWPDGKKCAAMLTINLNASPLLFIRAQTGSLHRLSAPQCTKKKKTAGNI